MAEHSNRPDEDNSPEESAEVSAWRARVDTLRALVELAQETKLSELELEQDGVRLSLKSPAAAKSKIQYTGAVPTAAEAGLGSEEAIEAGDDDDDEQPPVEDAGLIPVVSPMVGIFYRAASPNDPNFIEVGDHVEVGQTLGLVETMKVFNEITSEIEGTVVAIQVINMALVETGDMLLTIRKS